MIKLSTPFRLITIIIAGLFVSEMISMGVIGILGSLSYLRLSVIDSSLMILLATPLLYYFSLQPLIKVISEREAEIVQRKQTETQLRIQTKALETAANGVIVTDKQGKILWANQAFAGTTGYSIEEVLGRTPNFLRSGVHSREFHQQMWGTILSGNVWHGEVINRHKDGTLYVNEQTITPVFNSLGDIQNFIAINQDVTDRKRAESILQARLRLMQFATSHTLNELLQATLDEIETLTNSAVGFFHFLEPDQKTLRLQAWSTNTIKTLCKVTNGDNHYDMQQAGVWADCARQRKAIIHNDYEILPDHKSLPEGHARIIRELTVPILRNEKVVAILGVGNKNLNYTAGDVELVLALADFAWDVIERKQTEDALREQDRKTNLLSQTIHSMQMDIARDLHDTVGQNISYLRLKLDHIVERNLVADPNVAQDIKNMSEVANESYDMMRGTLAALQAEDAADLSHLFARYASQIEERSKFMIEFANHGQPRMVSAIQMRQLFYVFREILSNIEKHADASQVSIDMTWDEEYITLVVFDNGRGFDSTDPHSGHYGLRFIQDRLASLNGTISIYSAIGSGSEIIIQVPCEQ